MILPIAVSGPTNIYIQIPKTGGYTSFPKAYDGRGMKIHNPPRGGAVLLYSMLPDGNGDDLSLHGGDTVLSREDEKSVAKRPKML